MPQVASEPTTHAIKPSLPNPARAAQNSDRAQGSPFESLLDEGRQATSEQPPQSPPASGNKTARTARPDSAQAPAQAPAQGSNTAQPGGKAAQPGDNANSAADIVAAIATAASAGNAVGADKANAGAKTTEQAAAGDDAKLLSDGKATDGLTPANPAAVATNDPIQTLMPVAAVAPAPGTIAPAVPAAIAQPAPAAGPQAAPDGVAQAVPTALLQAATATVPQAALAPKHPAIVAAEAPKAKPANFAAAQADTGKPADDSNSPAKTAFELPGDGKPQPAAGDADNTALAHPHDEVPTNTHHAAAQTPPAVAADAQTAVPKAATDAVPQASLTPPTHDVSAAPANPAAPAPPAAQAAAVPLAGVAIEIAGKALAGKNRFEIRLDPPELGRIEVRLDVDRDGHVTSRLIADRSDTLDLLRRDAAGLERALQDAGLKTSDNGLQFSLRDQSMGREQGNAPTPGAAQLVVSDDALPTIEANPRNYGRLAGLGGGIDIRV